MNIKKVGLFAFLLPAIASCTMGTDLSLTDRSFCNLISTTVSTNEVSGTIHNIEGVGSFFKWNGALFSINEPNKKFNMNDTAIYKDDNLMEFDSSLLTEGLECKGRITYGLGGECSTDVDLLEVPYLSFLYIGKHEGKTEFPELGKIYFVRIDGKVKSISSEESYFDYNGILFSIDSYTSVSLNKQSISSSSLASYEGIENATARGRIGFSDAELLDQGTKIPTPYLSDLSITYEK